MVNTLPSKIRRKLTQAAQLLADLRYRADLAQHAAQLPPLSPADRQIVETCRREGVCVTTLNALGCDETAAMLAGAKRQLDVMRFVLPIEQVRDRIAKTQQAMHPQIFTVTDLAEFANWGSSPRLLAIAENYIGLPVRFQGVHLRRDFANPNPITTELWHQDIEDRRILKAIVYLSDVDAAIGAFEYIPKAQVSPLLAWRIHKRIERSSTIGISDAVMETFVARSQWKACLGPSGTVIFTDPR
ncbi:MAG: phytanoyl-CoA dioxygenase family protein, partial [Microcoleus sp. SIO2G3]|nr:phytanoyl-CoA dioxygenase family protein [Microcoleus sp. SIO2G3]